MPKLQGAIVLASLLATSCVKSDEVECIAGYSACGGACVRMAIEGDHCGACGRTCGAHEICANGSCVGTCESSLHAPISDPWTNGWDGLERPAASFGAARAACAAIGGRLPSATELYRVSAVKSGAVGDVHATNAVWSITPDGASAAYALSLSDGQASSFAMTSLRPFRCVCPAARPAAFAAGACNGPAGAECAVHGGDPRFHLDAEDRPAMSKAAAISECALAGGDLPTVERLAAAAFRGLANGSGSALHSADDTGHFHQNPVCLHQRCTILACECDRWSAAVDEEYEALVSFTAAAPTFSEGAVQEARPFRCYGPAAPGAVPAAVADGFREPRGERTVDAGPDHLGTTYTTAIADCFARGGHLPTVTELAAMAAQGLPAGGSAGARLTADQTLSGYAATFAWSGSAYWPLDPDLAATAPTSEGVPYLWAGTSVSDLRNDDATGKPYRCIYHAVDPSFTGPVDAQCSGGCFPVPPATISPAAPRMWFDRSVRGGTATDTYVTAIRECATQGGRLASARDLVEAIRSTPGLDNGPTATTILAADVTRGLNARTLTWVGGANQDFTDTGAASGVVALTATGVKYRCLWTNEIR